MFAHQNPEFPEEGTAGLENNWALSRIYKLMLIIEQIDDQGWQPWPWHFCWTSRIPDAATSGKLPVAYGLKLWDSVVHVNHIHVVHVKCSCNNCLPSVKLIDTSKRLDRLYLTYPIFYMHIVIILVCKESKFSFKFYPLENELKP